MAPAVGKSPHPHPAQAPPGAKEIAAAGNDTTGNGALERSGLRYNAGVAMFQLRVPVLRYVGQSLRGQGLIWS